MNQTVPPVIVTLRIRALAYGGSFVGDVVSAPDHTLLGMRAFVPFAATGELIEASIVARHDRYLEASLLRVIEPSLERVSPPCPVYERCGGCDVQHLSLGEQRRAKRDMILSTLERQAKLRPTQDLEDLSDSLPGFHYRRRSMLHVSPAGEIGFFKPGTGDVVPLTSCAVLETELDALVPSLGRALAGQGQLVASVILETRPRGRAMIVRPRSLNPSPAEFTELHRLCDELRSKVDFVLLRGEKNEDIGEDLGHFSQINGAGNAILVQTVLDELQGDAITDLYAGAGNFSFPLARRGANVVAVELDRELVRAGEATAAQENLPVRFVGQSVERFLKGNRCLPSVLLDPPRAGARCVAQVLAPATNPHLVYVSCNLPSLARDLRILVDRGYELKKLKMIDMFPQTHHVELVAVLG